MARISDRIKMLRTTAGMTQEEFGKIFGIVKSTVSLYESGKSCPNDQMKLQICDYFNVPLDFLIGISNVSTYNTDGFTKGLLSDGSCRSAFLDLLEIRKLSYEDVSVQTGIEVVALRDWFLKEVPSLQQLVLVADCLNTSVDYLLGRIGDFNQPNTEDAECLSYYRQLPKMDRQWVVGQMIDIIRKQEQESEESFNISVAAEVPLKKAK